MGKSRIFWMVITAAVLAVVLWGIVTLRGESNSGAGSAAGPGAGQTLQDRYQPVTFSNASSQARILTVSGTSTPGSIVNLRKGDTILMDTQTGSDGKWNAQLNMAQIGIGGSGFSIEAVASLPDGTHMRALETLFIVSGPSADPLSISDPMPLPPPAILKVQPGGPTRVLQSPFGALPERNGLVLEAADYDNAGGIIFTGTASQDGFVRIFANSALIGETGIGDAGRWTLIAGSTLPVSAYTVRIVLLNLSGEPVADMSVPFERLAPDVIIAAISGDDEGQTQIPKQGQMSGAIFKDDNWQLSRSLYGGGYQHSVIYAPIVLVP